MNKLEIIINTLQPVILSRFSGDRNIIRTDNFISGQKIFGVFANYLFNKLGNNTFSNLFSSNDLIFNNAYPCSYDEHGDLKVFTPVPLNIQSLKNSPNEAYNIFINNPEEQTKINSFYGVIDGRNISKTTVKKSVNFHHKRDPKRGSSETGVIFNYEAINAGQMFHTTISGDDNLIEMLKSLINSKTVFHIGRSRNSQYGKVEITEISSQKENDSVININNSTLVLLSDLILYDENGEPSMDLSNLQRYLSSYFGGEISIIKSAATTKNIESYIAKWKAKRNLEKGFAAGSAFLITASDNSSLSTPPSGLMGERNLEGFGQFILINNFPERFFIEDSREKKEDFSYCKNNPIAPCAKQILISSVRKEILKLKRIEAIELVESQTLKGFNTSTISRLNSMLDRNRRIEEFITSIKKSRETFKEKLKDLIFHDKEFYEYLTSIKVKSIETLMSDNNAAFIFKPLEDKIIETSDIIDSNFNNDIISYEFLKALFNQIRKKIKRGKK